VNQKRSSARNYEQTHLSCHPVRAAYSLRRRKSPGASAQEDLFASHLTVNHSIDEYVRGDAHTNTVEGYFSSFKRGIYGVYHQVSQEHLKRYLCELPSVTIIAWHSGFTDMQRAEITAAGIYGDRLTYRRTGERTNQQT
jgi:hypothetical protein